MLSNVHIEADYSSGLQLWRVNDDVVIRDSTIVGAENQLGTVKNTLIEDNVWVQRNDSTTAIYVYGGWNQAVIGNTSHDHGDWQVEPDTREQGVGRFFTCTCESQRHENIYLGYNRTRDLTVRAQYFDQNRGEQIMWEYKPIRGERGVVRAEGDRVFIDGGLDGGRNWYMDALITAGRGVGQTRQVYDWVPGENSLRVDVPWRVAPDETSTVRVLEQIKRIVVHRNTLDAKPRAWQSESHIASAGVQPFLSSYGLVVDDNTFTDIRAGVPTYQSAWSLLVQHNRFDRGRVGVRLTAAELSTPAVSSVVVRANTFAEMVEHGVRLDGRPTAAGAASQRVHVIEGNTLTDLPRALTLGDPIRPGGVGGTLVRRNDATRGAAPLAGSVGLEIVGPEAPIEVDNTFEGFEAPVTGP